MGQNQQDQFQNQVEGIKRDTEEKDYKEYAEKLNLEYIDLKRYPISPEVLNIIPKAVAKENKVISYLKAGNKIKLATPDPKNERFRNFLESFKSATKFNFFITVTSPFNINYSLKLYDLIKTEIHKESDRIEITKEDERKIEENIKNLRDLKEGLKKVPTTRLLDLILTGAVKTKASDIHIESGEKEIVVRYRMDGILHPIIVLDPESSKAVISRVKFLAKLKLDISKMPQDGKFSITRNERRIDIRVSSLPEFYGESIVLRLFDKEAAFLRVEDLGFNSDQIKQLNKVSKKTHGLIFVTGPTGSGKTTTMYAILDRLNKPGVKIITLEDPIEYDLPGVIQSQVNKETGYTFPVGFRSLLRQDPDILLIGEVRDLETAEMGIQSSLTGHLVLTTLHTNDASSVIHRLLDIGVQPFLLVDAINLIIAQRLVRKICPKCREKYSPQSYVVKEMKRVLGKDIKIKHFLRGKGCDFCHYSGFKDRIGIFEFLELDEELKKLIMGIATLDEIKKAAKKSGMITMEEDGLAKVLKGITTPEEVWRVVKG